MTQFYSEKRRLHSVGTVVQGEKLRKDCVHNLNHKKKKNFLTSVILSLPYAPPKLVPGSTYLPPLRKKEEVGR
ncbi:hypothetical protein LshimejAT787_0805020 [Lyophyllum shimeji]|uniref:Uncharacterized protein n=1 Tax=Lyophyllum shimeji TaxID=47721 RepID=A0A9P3URY5_LYOSH|nr:hypothetical protein LshimejAT787_0805020 [Lyophyllum shimeji]